MYMLKDLAVLEGVFKKLLKKRAVFLSLVPVKSVNIVLPNKLKNVQILKLQSYSINIDNYYVLKYLCRSICVILKRIIKDDQSITN